MKALFAVFIVLSIVCSGCTPEGGMYSYFLSHGNLIRNIIETVAIVFVAGATIAGFLNAWQSKKIAEASIKTGEKPKLYLYFREDTDAVYIKNLGNGVAEEVKFTVNTNLPDKASKYLPPIFPDEALQLGFISIQTFGDMLNDKAVIHLDYKNSKRKKMPTEKIPVDRYKGYIRQRQ